MADRTQTLVVKFVADSANLNKGVDQLTSKFGGVTSALKGIAAAGVVVGAMNFLKGAISEAEDAAKVGRQTEAVLKSTGQAAKVSAEQIGEMATRLSNLSGVDDEVIQSGINVLLTFTKVRNEVGKGNNIFDQATAVALDMSAALGTDLQASVIQVGKALNDPIKGVTALQKVGVSFTAQQKEEIKALTAKGDVLGAQKLILKELNTEFGGMAAASATASQKLATSWGNFKEAIGTALLPAFGTIVSYLTDNLLPASDGAFGGLAVKAQQAADFIMTRVLPAIGSVVQFIRDDVLPVWGLVGGNLFKAFGPVLKLLVENFLPVIALVAQTLWDVLGKAVVAVSGFMRDHEEAVWAVVAAFVAWGTVSGIQSLVGLITGVKVAMEGLNLAIKANAIILIITLVVAIVAAFIALWQKSAAFRDFWIGIWEAIQAAAKWAWENVIKPVVDALIGAWRAVSEAFTTVWNSGIKPVIDALAAAAMWLWQNVIMPVVDGITAAWQFLQPVFEVVGAAIGLVFSVIKGAAEIMWAALKVIFDIVGIAWQLLGAAIGFVWTVLIEPVFILLGRAFRLVGEIFVEAWQDFIQPALKAFGDFCGWVWNNVLRPVFDAIGVGFRAVGDAMGWVYNNVIKPVIGFFADLFTGMQKVVEGVVGAIKASWDTLGKIFGTPVKFVVDYIWNKGIVAFWNWIADKVGFGKLNEIDTSGWPHFAGGGSVHGRGGPRDDKIPAMLSNGEYVMPSDKTSKYYPILEAMRQGAPLQGFADGGVAGVIGQVIDWVGGAIGDAINFIKDPIGAVTRAIGTGGQWLGMMARIPGNLIGSAAKWLWDKISTLVETNMPLSAGDHGAAGTIPYDKRIPYIMAALTYVPGHPNSWLAGYYTLINRESGWNPGAVNNWDSNAAKGTPSMGLTQTIRPTFERFRDKTLNSNIFDPLSNIVASANYVMARYGPVLIQQMDPSKPPKGYDSGGWLAPGYSTVYNGTGQPEMVLNRQQQDALSGRVNNYYLTVVNAANSQVDLVDQFNRMALMAGTGVVSP
jgi:SLT domain-containing protein/phage-related protein